MLNSRELDEHADKRPVLVAVADKDDPDLPF